MNKYDMAGEVIKFINRTMKLIYNKDNVVYPHILSASFNNNTNSYKMYMVEIDIGELVMILTNCSDKQLRGEEYYFILSFTGWIRNEKSLLNLFDIKKAYDIISSIKEYSDEELLLYLKMTGYFKV